MIINKGGFLQFSLTHYEFINSLHIIHGIDTLYTEFDSTFHVLDKTYKFAFLITWQRGIDFTLRITYTVVISF